MVTDRDKLRQILLNLLSNAIKYTDHGSITVRATPTTAALRIDVSDTGVGIPSDELGRIFDEFHRADSTSARLRRGTGLGLTISRRLARALGGDITVESRLGAGSTSRSIYPFSDERTSERVRKRLLIVEDDELESRSARADLRGHLRDRARHGRRGGGRGRRGSIPDLILMDIGLPGLSGLDAVRRSERTGANIRSSR